MQGLKGLVLRASLQHLSKNPWMPQDEDENTDQKYLQIIWIKVLTHLPTRLYLGMARKGHKITQMT